MKGIFKLQDEIAGAVVKHLKLSLLAVPSNTHSPVNTEAYNLLLQGNYFSDKRDKENVAKALKFYLQAVTIDSLNARAWAALQNVLTYRSAAGDWNRSQEDFKRYSKGAETVTEFAALH